MLAKSCCRFETGLGTRALLEIAKLGANGSDLGPIAMLSFDAMRAIGLATDSHPTRKSQARVA